MSATKNVKTNAEWVWMDHIRTNPRDEAEVVIKFRRKGKGGKRGGRVVEVHVAIDSDGLWNLNHEIRRAFTGIRNKKRDTYQGIEKELAEMGGAVEPRKPTP